MTDAYRQRLHTLLARAQQQPGRKVQTHLTDHLRVALVYTPPITYLAVSCGCYLPTQADWNTVLHNWPYPLHVEPMVKRQKGVIVLYARFGSEEC